MEFVADGLLVLFHVLFATLWFGGAAYQVLIIGRALMAAGPQATGFMLALAKRGGIGKYFALNGALTIVFGAILFGRETSRGGLEPMEGRGLWLSLGATVAVLAYLHGLMVNMPTEKKWLALCNGIQGAPTPTQGKQMGEFGQKLGKAGAHSAIMVGVALLLMLMGRVFV